MARIRTTKPEFWTSEQVTSCSREARLLFIGMWNFCDDAGVHPKSFMRLKMEVLPGDDCTVHQIEGWIEELIKAGLVIEYSAEGKSYWQVSGWKHQKIDKPTYRYPAPATYLKSNQHQSINQTAITSQLLVEQSSNNRQSLIPGREWSGKGEEKVIHKVSSETSSPSFYGDEVLANTHEPESGALQVFTYWQVKMSHPRAKFDKKRRSRIQAAFKLGYHIDQLKQAIDGCALTPFNMGQNKDGQKYDSIDLIFRDAEHIERFMQNALANSAEASLNSTVRKMDQIAEGAI